MAWVARVLRSRLLWRGAMIVALFVALQSLLYRERAALIDQEANFGHAVLDNAWSISELLNETRNTTARLTAYSVGRAERHEVQLGYEILWSRLAALDFAGRVQFEGLAPLVADYHAVLERHDPVVFDPAPLDLTTALEMVTELDALASRTRQLWSVHFNQNRSHFLGLLSGQLKGSARGIDALMALVALGGIAYLGLELLLSNAALRREQRLAEEARSASEMKTAFLANMSHEVRTPLSGVIGSAELLGATELDRDQRLLADTIATSAEHLLGVVNQVLDISKIEAGKVEIEDAIVDLYALTRVVLAMFRKPALEKGVAIELLLAPDVPPHVRGDPLRLRQVLANLVSNAVKFTDAGKIAVTIAAAPDTGAGRRLVLTVEDTGIGIPKEALKRVFDAFTQSDVSDTRRFGGTGLGLTISRQLVQLMDGDLKLHSWAGTGTRVTLDLPLRPVTVFGAAPSEAPEPPAGPVPLTILIADDNATNRLLLSRMLRPLVREVREATDGGGAVALWQQGEIDLVLLDIQMPVMTGIEAATAIRAAEQAKGLRPVPIYSISANAMPQQIETYAAAGMNGHLSKPFRKADLVELVQRHRPGEKGTLAA
jgi:two-component system, sensor histidine kinase